MGRRQTWIKSAHRISHSSCRSKTTRLASSRCMTGRSISTFPTSPKTFDLLFKFTKGAPPSPCRKYLQEFIDFAAGANRPPIGFYQAYPGLSVQDIHALIADKKSESASPAA